MNAELTQKFPLWQREPLGALLEWWQDSDNARGDGAVLRRCHSLADVVLTPAFNRLRVDLGGCGHLGEADIVPLAVVAGVLSHVTPPRKKDEIEQVLHPKTNSNIVYEMGDPRDKSKPPVSEGRFRRLLAISESEPEELYRVMVRLVHLLGGTWKLG